ncbi:MAG: hypothetical protein ACE5HV_04430 [Acidobacteriota bacterium]
MHEVLPGVFHWRTFHQRINHEVDSYLIAATRPAVLIDPRVPEEGVDWFQQHGPPEQIYLTNRHHYRHSEQFVEALGVRVWCHLEGLHEFQEHQGVEAFAHGDKLPAGIQALKVDVLCPEETALLIPHAGGILAIGDAFIQDGDSFGFVPDQFMGDEPLAVKKGLSSALRGLLERDFDHLLLAHGEPCIGGAREKLRGFLDGLKL